MNLGGRSGDGGNVGFEIFIFSFPPPWFAFLLGGFVKVFFLFLWGCWVFFFLENGQRNLISSVVLLRKF